MILFKGEERQKLKIIFDFVNIPKNNGMIILFAQIDKSVGEIQTDLDTLIAIWNILKKK